MCLIGNGVSTVPPVETKISSRRGSGGIKRRGRSSKISKRGVVGGILNGWVTLNGGGSGKGGASLNARATYYGVASGNGGITALGGTIVNGGITALGGGTGAEGIPANGGTIVNGRITAHGEETINGGGDTVNGGATVNGGGADNEEGIINGDINSEPEQLPTEGGDGGESPGGYFSPPPGPERKKYIVMEAPGIETWISLAWDKFLTVALVYLIVYYEVSMFWLLGHILLLVVREQQRHEEESKRAVAQAFAFEHEREMILERIGDNMPPMVILPDVERAEWINTIIEQLWPRIRMNVSDLLLDLIEPRLREKTGPFKIAHFVLGDKPLRVGGFKVLEHDKDSSATEIILDVEVIYVGDCDITISSSTFTVGLKNLELQGTFRLAFKPLLDRMPVIGGFEYSFVTPPYLNFQLDGKLPFSLNLLLRPVPLSNMIRKHVQRQLASTCVLPNKKFVSLIDIKDDRLAGMPHIVKFLMERVEGYYKSPPSTTITSCDTINTT